MMRAPLLWFIAWWLGFLIELFLTSTAHFVALRPWFSGWIAATVFLKCSFLQGVFFFYGITALLCFLGGAPWVPLLNISLLIVICLMLRQRSLIYRPLFTVCLLFLTLCFPQLLLSFYDKLHLGFLGLNGTTLKYLGFAFFNFGLGFFFYFYFIRRS